MDRQERNRAKQLPIEKKYIKGVSLIDIDTTIAEYMSSVVIPDVDENGNKLKVPLIYGNAERWAAARKEGYLRDTRGRIQIPLVMFKRNSIERNNNLQHFREQLTIPAVRKYTQKNRYERFSLQNNAGAAYENYSVHVPAYVTVTYEVMIWTSFTEHMNKIVEAFQYATDRYWGKEDGYKFKVKIDTFENQQEVGQGSERIIRTTFNMVVNAYLLADKYNEKPTVKKQLTPKRVQFGVETDLTGDAFTKNSLYNEYAQVVDFIGLKSVQTAQFVNGTTIKLTNVRKPVLPSELIGVFDTKNWFRVYINGDFISPGNYQNGVFASNYSYTFNSATNEIIFIFSGLSYTLDAQDEIEITGKFEQID
jgi:hypothetical protein